MLPEATAVLPTEDLLIRAERNKPPNVLMDGDAVLPKRLAAEYLLGFALVAAAVAVVGFCCWLQQDAHLHR